MDPYFLELTAVKLAMGIIVGLVLGSFTTMLSYRLPRGLSIVKPRSTCPSCKTVLGIPDLIPVLSWPCARGKCRHCKAPIGGRYVLIELIITALTACAFYYAGFTAIVIPTLIFIVAVMTFLIIKVES